MNIKPINFTSVYKVNAPVEAAQRVCEIANFGLFKQEEIPAYLKAKKLFRPESNNEFIAVNDSKNQGSSYILTGIDSIAAKQIYYTMQDEIDIVDAYYSKDEEYLAQAEKERAAYWAQREIESLVDTAQEKPELYVKYDNKTDTIKRIDIVV